METYLPIPKERYIDLLEKEKELTELKKKHSELLDVIASREQIYEECTNDLEKGLKLYKKAFNMACMALSVLDIDCKYCNKTECTYVNDISCTPHIKEWFLKEASEVIGGREDV